MTNHKILPRVLHRFGNSHFPDTLSIGVNEDIAIYCGSVRITMSLNEWHHLGERQISFDKLPYWKKWIVNKLLT